MSLFYTYIYVLYIFYTICILLFLWVKNMIKAQLDSLDSGCNNQSISQAVFSFGGLTGKVSPFKLSQVVGRSYSLWLLD